MRGVCLCVAAFILTMGFVSIVVISVVVATEMLTDAELVKVITSHPYDWMSRVDSNYLTDLVSKATENYSGLASCIGMICGLPWFLLIRGKRFFTYDIPTRHSSPSLLLLLGLFVIIMGVQFFMSLVQMGLEPLFNQGGGSLVDNLEEGTQQLAADPWGLIYIMLVGPLCEELVFRGAVLRRLEKHGANFAIVTSALLFGLYHIILYQAVFAFLIGLVLAYTAGRFSLKWAIVLHVANNSLAVLSLYTTNDIAAAALGILFMLSLAATVVLLSTNRQLMRFQLAQGAPVSAHTYARAYISPWLIVYVVLTLFGGVLLLGIL